MDKNMLHQDLVNSAGDDKHFSKVLTPFNDTDCENYLITLRQIEAEGKITLEECKILDTGWGKVVRAKGFIH